MSSVATEPQGQEAQGAGRRPPAAVVQGRPLAEIPGSLYLPPNPLEVFLESFAGPLDLLLYLVRRGNLDILDIPIAQVTEQYMGYIDMMEELYLEPAGEYLVMAATLAEIKSRMLLPRPPRDDEEEEDPRAELVRRLLEYEKCKQAAADIDALPRQDRDTFGTVVEFPDKRVRRPLPEVPLDALLQSFSEVLQRAEVLSHHQVRRELLSVRERMASILERLGGSDFTDFRELLTTEEGRAGVIVVFLALLELSRAALVSITQNEANGPIYVKASSETH